MKHFEQACLKHQFVIDFAVIFLGFRFQVGAMLGSITIQEVKQNQIPKIAEHSTVPRWELNFEGSALLKMAHKSAKNPSEMVPDIDQKSDHILT